MTKRLLSLTLSLGMLVSIFTGISVASSYAGSCSDPKSSSYPCVPNTVGNSSTAIPAGTIIGAGNTKGSSPAPVVSVSPASTVIQNPPGTKQSPKPSVSPSATVTGNSFKTVSPAPSPSSSSCTTNMNSNGAGRLWISPGITCSTPPPGPAKIPVVSTIPSIITVPGVAYFNLNPATGSPSITGAPGAYAGAIGGQAGGNTSFTGAGSPCSSASQSYGSGNNTFTLPAYGVHWTDTINIETVTTTPVNGPPSVVIKYIIRKTAWDPNNCVFPGTITYGCSIDVGPISYTGVVGTGVEPVVTIPTGSVWTNNVINPVPVDSTHISGPSGSIWTRSGINTTSFGKAYQSSGGSLALIQSSKCSVTLGAPTINYPALEVTTPGQYKLSGPYHYVKCYAAIRSIGDYFVMCGSTVLSSSYQYYSKTACAPYGVNAIPTYDYSINYDISKCAGNSQSNSSSNPTPTPSSSPTPGGSVDYRIIFACSITGNPIITPPGLASTSGGGVFQVLSNQKSWSIYWPAATFSSMGTIQGSVTNKNTSLVIWSTSKPFNFNLSPTDPTQPIVGSPNLSLSSDDSSSVSTIPGWGSGSVSTLNFYKKGSAGDKVTISQRQWFTAKFLQPSISTDINGNTTITPVPILLTRYCDASTKQSFSVLGVTSVPGK